MLEGVKPYDDYRDTDSQWLGKVPARWDVRNLRTLIRPRNERNKPELPLLSVAREKGVFIRSLTDPNENHNVIPEDLSNYKVAKAGSLVINKMKAWQGSMGIAPCEGIVSPAYYVYDLSFSNRLYAQMLLRSKPYVAHFAQASDGVRVGQWDLSISGMKQIPVLIPPPEEQTAIVRYLHYTNGRIDRAIREKRKTIALLNEQKQAITYHAITRGVNDTNKTKETGLPWIQQIPENWSLHPNRSLMKKRKVLVGEAHTKYKLLSLTKKGVIIRDIDSGKGKFSSDMGTSQEVRKGDLIFCLFDVPETPRTVGLSNHDGMITSAYTVFECFDPVTASYLELFYKAMDDRKLLSPLYSGLRNTIPPQRFLGTKTPLPPVAERQDIVKNITEKAAEIDKAILKLEKELSLIGEYRTRLISDVVTGKLDVREAVKALAEENIVETIEDTDEVREEIEEAA